MSKTRRLQKPSHLVQCPAKPNPRGESGERGNQSVGANHDVASWGAGSFSASPSANPAGRRKRSMSLFPRAFAPIFIAMLCVIAPTGALAQTLLPPEAPPSRRSRRRRDARRPGSGPDPRCRAPRPKLLAGRHRRRARRRARAGQAGHLGRQRDAGPALPLRRRAQPRVRVADGADCSGTVSFALKAAGLLKTPLDSGSFMQWGKKGKGRWITVFANRGHAYVEDRRAAARHERRRHEPRKRTFAASAFESGPRWRPMGRSPRAS